MSQLFSSVIRLSKKFHVSLASWRTSSVSFSLRDFLSWGNFLPNQYIRNGAPHHARMQNTVAQ